MLILISNDDGIHAPGLAALAEAAATLGETWVVAPSTEQSAKSHALTMHEPLRVRKHGDRRFSVTGTPADSVYVALSHLLPRTPDIVLSGVNRGSNLGSDVYYSGTVAAAREAALKGIPAIAASLYVTDWSPDSTFHYDVAAQITVQVAERLLQDPLAPKAFLNINVPDRPMDQLKGIRAAPTGERAYASKVTEKRDPRGKRYYWIGGAPLGFGGGPHTDGELVDAGYAAITPLRIDPTDHASVARVASWLPLS